MGEGQGKAVVGAKKDGLPKTAAEGVYSCSTCDRGFDSARDLHAHTEGHTHCEHPGCTFAAQRKIVQEHVKKAHRVEGQPQEGDGGAVRDAQGRVLLPPALLDLIPPRYRSAAAVGDSEEEIAKWREERKRRYPTAAQAEVKKAQADARAERGGIVDRARPSGHRFPPPPRPSAQTTAAEELTGHKRARQEDAAPGTESVSSEEDESPPEELSSGPAAVALLPPLPSPQAERQALSAHGRKRHKEICKQYVFGGCTAGARCQYAHSAEAEAASSARPGRALLSKLLAAEGEKETSITLQAIRYIVRKGFFMGDRGAAGLQVAAEHNTS